jgi:hypothetical protein
MGDVEHYRPKGGVTDENDNPVEIDDGRGGKRPHPGYYWLAYDATNLLPSCIACNRPNKVGKARVGKWNRFPVIGNHASTKSEIPRETPLLLNPLVPTDDPAKHLVFDPATGRIIGKTDRGRMTVAILNLNREGLPEARRDVFDSVIARSRDALFSRLDDNKEKSAQHVHFVMQHMLGHAEYAMAGRASLAKYHATVQELSQVLTLSKQ